MIKLTPKARYEFDVLTDKYEILCCILGYYVRKYDVENTKKYNKFRLKFLKNFESLLKENAVEKDVISLFKLKKYDDLSKKLSFVKRIKQSDEELVRTIYGNLNRNKAFLYRILMSIGYVDRMPYFYCASKLVFKKQYEEIFSFLKEGYKLSGDNYIFGLIGDICRLKKEYEKAFLYLSYFYDENEQDRKMPADSIEKVVLKMMKTGVRDKKECKTEYKFVNKKENIKILEMLKFLTSGGRNNNYVKELFDNFYNREMFKASKAVLKYYSVSDKKSRAVFYLMKSNLNMKTDKNISETVSLLEKYIRIVEDDASAYNSLGCCYVELNMNKYYDKAYECFKKALKLSPENPNFLHNMYLLEKDSKTWEQNFKTLKKITSLRGTYDERWKFSTAVIKNGDLKYGYKLYKDRFKNETITIAYPKELTGKKSWRGQDLTDKTILVHFEQGFGDMIMYSRFLYKLEKIAGKVILVVQDKLTELFSNNFDFEIYGESHCNLKKLKYDYCVAMMDLPYFFKCTKDTMPYRDGYLKASLQRVEDYKNRFCRNDKFKIGIGYLGHPNNRGLKRDTELVNFKVLAKIPNVQLYCLQVGDEETKEKTLKKYNIIDMSKTFADFNDTAAAIANMDLVVTIDNVLLNLAGAMGVKTFGLFNQNSDYRWYTLGEDVGWYSSVIPIQAKEKDDWKGVFKQLKKLTESYIDKKIG
ncbi:glycosyltransferase [bacterium]|nr:glycosyltransferase [bacterium]